MKNKSFAVSSPPRWRPFPARIQAQPDAHYVPGIEGIKCATLPPPGFYFRDYNVFYLADQAEQRGRAQRRPGQFPGDGLRHRAPRDLDHRHKVLGGNLGGDVVLPFVYSSREGAVRSASSTFGIGDFYGEGTLSWHPGQFDIGSAVGFWAPTGDSGKSDLDTARNRLLDAGTHVGSDLVSRRGKDLGDFGAEPV